LFIYSNKVIIDCEKLGNTRNMAETTKNLAKELGYFPIFTWLASMSGLLDTIVGATTGQKTGLSSRPESQIKEVLETSAIALRDIAPDEAKRRLRQEEKENQVPWIDKFKNYVMGSSELMKDIEKKVEKEVKKVEKKSDENIPIVVIDNFMYRETAKSQVVWEELANWASLLIENEIAHVVFISSNGGAAKTLAKGKRSRKEVKMEGVKKNRDVYIRIVCLLLLFIYFDNNNNKKALPGKSFSSIALSDAPPEMSLSYVQKQLKSEVQDPYLPEVVSALGGRLSELEMLVAKMKMNMYAKSKRRL
jgi:hypothetical protein